MLRLVEGQSLTHKNIICVYSQKCERKNLKKKEFLKNLFHNLLNSANLKSQIIDSFFERQIILVPIYLLYLFFSNTTNLCCFLFLLKFC